MIFFKKYTFYSNGFEPRQFKAGERNAGDFQLAHSDKKIVVNFPVTDDLDDLKSLLDFTHSIERLTEKVYALNEVTQEVQVLSEENFNNIEVNSTRIKTDFGEYWGNCKAAYVSTELRQSKGENNGNSKDKN